MLHVLLPCRDGFGLTLEVTSLKCTDVPTFQSDLALSENHSCWDCWDAGLQRRVKSKNHIEIIKKNIKKKP